MLNITMTLSRCRWLKVYHNVLRDLELSQIEMKCIACQVIPVLRNILMLF